MESRFLSDFKDDNATLQSPGSPSLTGPGGLPAPCSAGTRAPPPPPPVLPARLGTRGRDSWDDTLSRQCQPCQLLFPHGREHWKREIILIATEDQGQQEALVRLPSCQLTCPSSCSPWRPGGGLLTDPRAPNTQPTSQAPAGTAGVSWGLRRDGHCAEGVQPWQRPRRGSTTWVFPAGLPPRDRGRTGGVKAPRAPVEQSLLFSGPQNEPRPMDPKPRPHTCRPPGTGPGHLQISKIFRDAGFPDGFQALDGGPVTGRVPHEAPETPR